MALGKEFTESGCHCSATVTVTGYIASALAATSKLSHKCLLSCTLLMLLLQFRLNQVVVGKLFTLVFL